MPGFRGNKNRFDEYDDKKQQGHCYFIPLRFFYIRETNYHYLDTLTWWLSNFFYATVNLIVSFAVFLIYGLRHAYQYGKERRWGKLLANITVAAGTGVMGWFAFQLLNAGLGGLLATDITLAVALASVVIAACFTYGSMAFVVENCFLGCATQNKGAGIERRESLEAKTDLIPTGFSVGCRERRKNSVGEVYQPSYRPLNTPERVKCDQRYLQYTPGQEHVYYEPINNNSANRRKI